MCLTEVSTQGVWEYCYPVKLGPLRLTSRMTVIQLESGGLWIHSPCPPSKVVVAALKSLGPVEFVVAPNKLHHLHFAEFLSFFPSARGFIAPGLAEKRPDLVYHDALDPASSPWRTEIDSVFIEGLHILEETAFVHKRSKTLLLTDLLFNFMSEDGLIMALVTRALGIHRKLAMSRTMRLSISNPQHFRESISQLQQLDFTRIIVAHGAIVENFPRDHLKDVFPFIPES